MIKLGVNYAVTDNGLRRFLLRDYWRGVMSNPGRYLNSLASIKDQAPRGLAAPAAGNGAVHTGLSLRKVCSDLQLKNETEDFQTSVSVCPY